MSQEVKLVHEWRAANASLVQSLSSLVNAVASAGPSQRYVGLVDVLEGLISTQCALCSDLSTSVSHDMLRSCFVDCDRYLDQLVWHRLSVCVHVSVSLCVNPNRCTSSWDSEKF